MITRLSEKFPTGALAEVVCDCDRWPDLTPATAHVASVTVRRDLAHYIKAADAASRRATKAEGQFS